MLGYFIWTLFWIFFSGLCFLPAGWVLNSTVEGDDLTARQWVTRGALSVVLVALFFAVLVTRIAASDSRSEHEWKGGNGPDTVCQFEQRTVMVGKVAHHETYTVCR